MAINDCTDYQRFHHDKMNNLVSLTSPFVLFRFVPYRSSAFLVARCNYMNDVLFFLPFPYSRSHRRRRAIRSFVRLYACGKGEHTGRVEETEQRRPLLE